MCTVQTTVKKTSGVCSGSEGGLVEVVVSEPPASCELLPKLCRLLLLQRIMGSVLIRHIIPSE